MLPESESRLSNGLKNASSNFLPGEVTQDCAGEVISTGVVYFPCTNEIQASVQPYSGGMYVISNECEGGKQTACEELFLGNLVNRDSVRPVPGGIAVQEIGGDRGVSAIAARGEVEVMIFANQEELKGILATVQVARPEEAKYLEKTKTSLAESLLDCTSIGILVIAALSAVMIGRLSSQRSPARRVYPKLRTPPTDLTQSKSSNGPSKIRPLPTELELLGTKGMRDSRVLRQEFSHRLHLIDSASGIYSGYSEEKIEDAKRRLIEEFVMRSGALQPTEYIDID